MARGFLNLADVPVASVEPEEVLPANVVTHPVAITNLRIVLFYRSET